jgi:hypothetical protein
MRRVTRAAARYRSAQDGIESWHCFSAGAHYDPLNVSFGPIIGVDEHVLEPGAGFDWHGHRGVQIVSVVLDGTLRHEDSNGEVRFVEPGALLVQSTGAGVRHLEANASDSAPLRFIQTTILAAGAPALSLARPPQPVAGVTVDVRRGPVQVGGCDNAYVLVLAGDYYADGDPIEVGAAVRVDGGDIESIEGAGELLVAIVTRR